LFVSTHNNAFALKLIATGRTDTHNSLGLAKQIYRLELSTLTYSHTL